MSEYERSQARFSEPGYAFGKEPNCFEIVRTTAAAIRPGIGDIADGEGRNVIG